MTVTPNDSWAQRESVLNDFERAWGSATRPAIEDYLPADDRSDNRDLLVELCVIDLEHRLRRSETARVEDYLTRFPELQATETTRTLLTGEVEIRCHLHQAPDRDEIVARFPNLSADLSGLFTSSTRAVATDSALQSERLHSGVRLVSGQTIGKYRLNEPVGAGSFAIVYSATEAGTDRTVAIKFLHSHAAANKTLRERILREARAAATLQHPNVVPVLEVGEFQGVDYIVSRFVDGLTLEQRLRESPTDARESARLTRALADAVEAAHRQGTVHRDIKPANVIMDGDQPMLTDFGLAHISDATHELTHEGDLVGTPSYMAPEQAAGKGWLADPRSDVYSLGVLLYRMLTGKLPFTGSTAEVLSQVLHKEPISPRVAQPGLPLDLETIVLHCLEKEPTDRYASARALAEDLQRFLDGRSIIAQPPTRLSRLLKWSRQRPALALSSLAILVLSAFLIGGGFQFGRVLFERDRARIAESMAVESEERTQRLLATSSETAGVLALQRGRYLEAIEHFDLGLRQKHDDPTALRLMKIDALLATNQTSLARAELARVRPTGDEYQRALWEAELLLATGQPGAEALFVSARETATGAEASYISGMLAETSPEAITHFESAIAADPFHRRARRMLVTTLLSLAEFDRVVQECQSAARLCAQDPAFPLMNALALAGLDRTEQAEQLIRELSLPEDEAAGWRKFVQAIDGLQLDMGEDESTINLKTLSDFAARLTDEFAPLLAGRGLHLTPKISRAFEKLPEHLATQDFLQLPTRLVELANGTENELARRIEADIAETARVHPEGSLLSLLGYLQLARGQVEQSRDTLIECLRRPSWLRNTNTPARINLITTTIVLGYTRGQDREENQAIFVRAARELPPAAVVTRGEFRAIVIGLLNAGENDLAATFADGWIAMPEFDWEAHWHKAIVEERRENWVGVIRQCELILDKNPAHESAVEFRKSARQKLADIVQQPGQPNEDR